MSPLDPRLERFKPALVYDPQEAYRAMSAASITDNRDNALKRENGAVVSRAGSGLTLTLLASYDVKDGDRVDEAGDYLAASRRFQGDPGYRERVYGRVKEDGGRTWLQYWLWCYYNPKHLLGWGKHEGDWEVVQVGLDGETPDVLTYSQHENGEARDWDKARRQGDHPIVYVAPLSHACYFEPGAHPYVFGVDNPDDSLKPVLPEVEELGAWSRWTGRWGASRGVVGGKFGGRSPAGPGRQGRKWDHPAAWHGRAKAAQPLRQSRSVVRQAGQGDLPEADRRRRAPRGRSRARRLPARSGAPAPRLAPAGDAAPRRRGRARARQLPRAGVGQRRDGRGAGAGGGRGRPHRPRLGLQRRCASAATRSRPP